jgi:hypothetical protein
MSRGGKNKLTAAEHMRRGTYQPSRHADSPGYRPHVLTKREEAWLAKLPPAAQRQGRHLLRDYMVADRHALRRYLLAFAQLDALPRTTATPLEALANQFAFVSGLLQETKWRLR